MTFDPTIPPPFSVSSLAERWQCSPSMIRKLIKQGKLRHFRIGELIRIPRAAVEEYESGAAAVAYVADASGQLAPPMESKRSHSKVVSIPPRRRKIRI